MIRLTPEATFVWFAFDVGGSWRKITWPLEIYLLHAKTAQTAAEVRCELWDAGEIGELTDQDWREINAARPFEKSKIEWERAKYLATGGGNRNGGLPIPEYQKAASA